MSIAPGIQTLKRLVGELGERGVGCVDGLVEQMRAVERAAVDENWHALATLCRAGAETIEVLARSDGLADQVDDVVRHLRQLIAFAERSVGAAEPGLAVDRVTVPAGVTPPAPRAVQDAPDADDERLFAETVELFVANAQGTLTDLEQELVALDGAGPRDEDAVAGVRRIVHTLKAEFGVLDMRGPQALCHQAESTIDACVDGGGAFPVDLLLAVRDCMQQFVERLADDVRAPFGDPEPLLGQLRAAADAATSSGDRAALQRPVPLAVVGEFAHELPTFLMAARAQLARAQAAIGAAAESEPGRGGEQLEAARGALQTIQRVARFLDLAPLRDLALAATQLLVASRARVDGPDRDDVSLLQQAAAMTERLLGALTGAAAPSIGEWRTLVGRLHTRAGSTALAPAATEVPADGDAAIEVKADGDAARESVAPVPRPSGHEGATAAPPAPAAQAAPSVPPAAPPGPPAQLPRPARVERTVKVSTDRLDALVDMVGELVIAQSMVLQDEAVQRLQGEALTRNIAQVGKITRELQEAAMSLRMVTVKATFQKMARLVRDVAGKAGKQVELSIVGEDTELDRTVVEQIGDPLVHLIRNAIDHGIEGPDERIRRGKSAQGQLTLRAHHQGGSIVIEVRDDGRGIERQRLLAKAIADGLLPGDATESSLPAGELERLIFRPGFSTAAAVTELSGRGVGMDVVRQNIERLRGKIDVESTPGSGTTFRLRLPLTLAIIDGMVVRVGGSRYVVPTLNIEHSFRATAANVCRILDRGECVRVRGAVLPVHRLKEVFGLAEGRDELRDGILIVVESNGERSCLFVDEIVGQQQVVIKSLGMSRDRVACLAGGAIMTDGRVALIVDVGTLVDSLAGSAAGAWSA